MKNFKEFMTESVMFGKLAPSVSYATDPQRNKDVIGTLHYKHGADYTVMRPDHATLKYFGKGIVMIKGATTGATSAAYVDWQKGTIRFSAGDQYDDKKFERAVKFKAATLHESIEDIELLDQLAEKLQLQEAEPVAGKTYKAKSNDMLLKYTGKMKGDQYVYMVVGSDGKPRIVAGKRHHVTYTKGNTNTLAMVECADEDITGFEFNEATDWEITADQFVNGIGSDTNE